MKILFVLALMPVFAMAAETETLTCQGRELVAGGKGKTGEVVIGVTMKNRATLDDGADITVSFGGVSLAGPGLACGIAVPAGIECFSRVTNPGKTAVVISSKCGEAHYRGSVPVYDSNTGIVISSDRSHGRLSCTGYDGQKSVRSAIEISNCEAK